jgi:hypothetical protein
MWWCGWGGGGLILLSSLLASIPLFYLSMVRNDIPHLDQCIQLERTSTFQTKGGKKLATVLWFLFTWVQCAYIVLMYNVNKLTHSLEMNPQFFCSTPLAVCGEPAISHDSNHVSLVQWTTCLLPFTRDSGSNPLGATYVKPGFSC